MIQNDNLSYTQETYNGTPKAVEYKIAFSDSVAKQKYADSGAYVEVTFNQDDGSFMYAEYSKSISRVSIFYNYGTYWDFREDAPGEYSGYYYHKPGDTSKTGIKIKYSNGYEAETSYHKVSSAEDAL